ncbi:hypothetical protein M427DRAFT_134734 [Gonapodya prolifera JEL478]|uniref:SH3 domain-containing protein n=1 Tax=Gonapodya prolifera (strain JEL478) TaxID=1344416 RepID=A0A139AH91_GONPJ|nr:hypothetical protein M427DRAFT_134734 [Gonapodya prolifera JEL478]|eukprot:KXS15934.1 hypothetical protein M427DRAFT_134734 [Gonapodya prolifera JEL478]
MAKALLTLLVAFVVGGLVRSSPSNKEGMWATPAGLSRPAGVLERDFYIQLARRDCPTSPTTTASASLSCKDPNLPNLCGSACAPKNTICCGASGTYCNSDQKCTNGGTACAANCGNSSTICGAGCIDTTVSQCCGTDPTDGSGLVCPVGRTCSISTRSCLGNSRRSYPESHDPSLANPPAGLRHLERRQSAANCPTGLSGSGTGPNVTAIAGGVAGGAAVAGLLIGFIVIRIRRNKKPPPTTTIVITTEAPKAAPSNGATASSPTMPSSHLTLPLVETLSSSSGSGKVSSTPASPTVLPGVTPLGYQGPFVIHTAMDGTQQIVPVPAQYPVVQQVQQMHPVQYLAVGTPGVNFGDVKGQPPMYKDSFSAPLSPGSTESGTVCTSSSTLPESQVPSLSFTGSASIGGSEVEINKRMQAAHQFVPTQLDEVEVNPGDMLLCRWLFPDGWLSGVNESRGTAGFFPLSIVSEPHLLVGDLRSHSLYTGTQLRTASFRSPLPLSGFSSLPMGSLLPPQSEFQINSVVRKDPTVLLESESRDLREAPAHASDGEKPTGVTTN